MPAFHPNRRTFLKGLGGSAVAAALTTPLLSACGGGSSSSTSSTSPTSSTSNSAGAAPVRGGKATVAIQDTPVNMDPADGQLYASLQVYQNIFSELISVDSKFNFKPNLATDWQQEDAKTWTFNLVDNAVFQNGEPFTAKDVAFTINRMKTHALGAYLGFFDKVKAVGDHKLQIQLSRPYGPMEATMASLVDIVNEKAIKSRDPKQSPIGTGPYKMADWVKGSHVTLSRWDKYFKSDRPYLDEVTFQSVGDDTVRLTGLQTGQFDWIQTVPPQQLSSLAGNASINHTNAAAYFPYILLLNTTAPPFNDIKVRQALSWAVDRSEIVKLAFFGGAVEATEAVSQPNPFYSGVNPYGGAPNIDKAKSVLSQASTSVRDVEVIVAQEDQSFVAIAQVLQSQMAKIGLNLSIKTMASAESFGRLASKKYGLGITYFSASLDPALTYYLLGQSASGFNLSGYKSARLDAALAKFTFQADQTVRKHVYPEMVQAFAEEAPFLFVANRQQQYWSKPGLNGVEVLPSLEIRAEDLWKQS